MILISSRRAVGWRVTQQRLQDQARRLLATDASMLQPVKRASALSKSSSPVDPAELRRQAEAAGYTYGRAKGWTGIASRRASAAEDNGDHARLERILAAASAASLGAYMLISMSDAKPVDKAKEQNRAGQLAYNPDASPTEQALRKKTVAWEISGHAHWVGLKSMFFTYAMTGAALTAANATQPWFRTILRAPQKVGLSLMLPIAAYGFSSTKEVEQCRANYQRFGVLPPQPPRAAYWSSWTGLYTDPRTWDNTGN
jgi:hypothetical protein